jgi:hypothetical protein
VVGIKPFYNETLAFTQADDPSFAVESHGEDAFDIFLKPQFPDALLSLFAKGVWGQEMMLGLASVAVCLSFDILPRPATVMDDLIQNVIAGHVVPAGVETEVAISVYAVKDPYLSEPVRRLVGLVSMFLGDRSDPSGYVLFH